MNMELTIYLTVDTILVAIFVTRAIRWYKARFGLRPGLWESVFYGDLFIIFTCINIFAAMCYLIPLIASIP